MKLCRFGLHKWTQWRTPRHHVQTRSCIHCGLYQRTLILVTLPNITIDEEMEEIHDSQIDEI